MRERWRFLFVASLGALIGVTWWTRTVHLEWGIWLNIQLLGLIAACGLAFAAMALDLNRRWPAIAVLLSIAPMGQSVLSSLPHLPMLLRYLGIPALLWMVGTAATIAGAIYALAAAAPLPTLDPIPRARLR
jgi:hypothetical protein